MVVEGLNKFYKGAFRDNIFARGVGGRIIYHFGVKKGGFRLFFTDCGVLLQSRPSFGPGHFSFQCGYCGGSGRREGFGSTYFGCGWWWSQLVGEQWERFVESVLGR